MDEQVPSRVLIIDDSEDFRVLLAHHLNAVYPGVDTQFYDPPSQGRPPPGYPWSSFDLLVMDYELGNNENGLDWLRAYRNEPDFPPAIVMTAHGDEELAVAAMKSGAQYYLNKGALRRDRLESVVTEVIAERQQARRVEESAALRHTIFDKAQFHRGVQEAASGGLAPGEATLLLVSLDRLEHMQQLLGLLEVDGLVAHLAECIASALDGEGDAVNVTRVGDGTVAALVRGEAQPDRAELLGAQLCSAISADRYEFQGEAVPVTVSVGVVPLEIGSDALSPRALLGQADVAVRMARQTEGNSYFVRAPQLSRSGRSATGADFNLASAVEEGRLHSRFQPLASVSDASGKLDASFYQCRVRVVGPQGELQEISGLLRDAPARRMLDRWVIRESIGRLFMMSAKGVRRGALFLRLSADTLSDKSFGAWLSGLVEHAKAPRILSGVVFEVQAQDVLGMEPPAIDTMRTLRKSYGTKFALTGALSTSIVQSCARRSPFAFVKLIPAGADGKPVLEREVAELASIVKQAQELGAFVVAERVETAEQLSLAIRLGADFVQGFFIADPKDDLASVDIVESLEFG